MPPRVVLVNGFWESYSGIFATIAHSLRTKHDLSTSVTAWPSTGHSSPGSPDMFDDIAAVRCFIEPLVRREQEVVVIAHSAAGFVASAAIKSLSKKEREAEGKKGGVIAVGLVAAGVQGVGTEPQPLPFFDVQGGYLYCKDERATLYNDLTDAQYEDWKDKMAPQPASDWVGGVDHPAWEYVPYTYLLCEKDGILPVAVQEHCANLASAKIERADVGHMVMITKPDVLLDFIVRLVTGAGK